MQDLDSPQEQQDLSPNRPSFSIYIPNNLMTPTEASQDNGGSSSNGRIDQQEPDDDFEFITCHSDKNIKYYPVFGNNVLLLDGKDNNSVNACNEGNKATTRTRRRPTLRQLFLEEDLLTSLENDKLAGMYCMQSPDLTCKKSSSTGWLSWFMKWRLTDFFRRSKSEGEGHNYHDKLYVNECEKRSRS